MREQLQHYFLGVVTITIAGDKKERFMNLCKSAGIYIWNIQYQENYVFSIYVEDIYRLKPILEKTKVHMHIIKKYGLPFFIHKYRKRKMFLPGMLVGFLLVYFMSLYIWDLQIEGNYYYTDYQMLKFLEEKGISCGIKKEVLDCDQIEKDIRNEYFDITWVSVEVTGTRLIIHIKENEEVLLEEDDTSKMIQNDNVAENEALAQNTYDLTATKDCVIKGITMRAGTPAVKLEMQVKAGDVLVYGLYEVLNDNKEVVRTQYLTADADIYGEVVYTYEESLPLKYLKKDYTEEENDYAIRIGNANYKFLKGKDEEKNTDVITEERQLSLYGNFYLPVYLMKNTTKTYKENEYIYTPEQATRICEENLQYFLEKLEKNTIQIIENNVTIEISGDSCISKGTIVVIEEVSALTPGTIKIPQPEVSTE